MCRLMAYVGQPQLLADIVLWPDRSIIKQSYDARERKIDPTLPFHLGHGNLNGDGFGIGWFSTEERREKDPTPCVFTSITPAWNNENLSRLACKIVSPLVFAHVRAAYPGMPVSEQNCHPFQFSRYMWMHNGVVAGFAQIRRSLLETLSDCAYNAVASFHSDSAVSFALFLNHLPDMRAQLAPDVLIKAMQDTIATISSIQRRHGITATSLLNYVVSDGTTLIATRFVSPDLDSPASLYYAEGASFARTPAASPPAPVAAPGGAPGAAAAAASAPAPTGGCGAATATAAAATATAGEGGSGAGAGPCSAPCSASTNSGSSITQESSYELGVSPQGPSVVFVASEPITASASDWVAVPKNTALVVTREKGGFLNTLRCPLRTTPQPQPIMSPAISVTTPAGSAGPAALAQLPWLRGSSGGGAAGHGPGQGALAFLDSQRDVCLCLEALSRGITAKSRAFLAHRATGLGMGGLSSVLPPAPETLQELPSTVSMAATGFSRSSLGGLPAGPSPSGQQQQQQQQQLLPQLEGAGAPMAPPASGSRTASVSLGDQAPSSDTHDYMRLVGHTAGVMTMTVCPHTNRLYTSSVDCSVRVWSLRDNSCLHTMIGQRKPVTAMRLRAQGRLLLASSGRKIRVWDAVGFRCLQLIKISDSCGTIRCLEVFGLQHGRHHHGRQAQAQTNEAAAPAVDGAAAGDGEVRSAERSARVSGGSPTSTSGRSSLTGGCDDGPGGALRFPPAAWARRSSADGRSSSVSLLEGLSMQDIILDGSTDRDGSSSLTAEGPSFGTGIGSAGSGGNGRASSSGIIAGVSLLYVGCQDTTVKVFTLDEHQLLAAAAAAAAAAAVANGALAPPPPPSLSAAAAAAGADVNGNNGDRSALLAAAAANASAPMPVPILKTASMKSLGTTTPPPSPFMASQLANRLARTSVTGVTGPPALLPPRIIATPEEPEHGVSDLTPLMVTAAEGGAHVGPVNCLALCGRYLCSGGGDATVRVWEAATLKLVGVLRGHRGSLLCLLGLGSSILLSGARDNTIRVWDLEMDMMCRRTLSGHKDDVTGLTALPLQRLGLGLGLGPVQAAASGAVVGTMTPPGRSILLASTLVASSSADGTVRLWSTAWTCLCILSLPISAGPSVPAALCNCLTSNTAMAGYSDGEVRLWHIDDITAAVLKSCYNELYSRGAEADALLGQPGCGCLARAGSNAAGERSASIQAALALLQQQTTAASAATGSGAAAAPGASVAAAAAAAAAVAAVTSRACRLHRSPTVSNWPCAEGGEDGAGSMERTQDGSAGPTPPAQTEAQAPAEPQAETHSQTQAEPQMQAQAQAQGRQSASMIESPSLAYLVGRLGSSAGASASPGSGNDSNLPSGHVSDSGAGVGSATATAAGAGAGVAPLPSSSATTTGGGAGTDLSSASAAADSRDGQPNGAAAAAGGAVKSQAEAAGNSALVCLPGGAPPSPGVPIHIHGRRSPLASASVTNLAAALAGGAQGNGAYCGGLLPLPLPLNAPLASLHFCSTSDQQLEAALREFVRIRTVSSSPKLRDDCHKGAKFLAKMLEGLGADVKVVQVYEDKNPVVIGRLGHSPDRPTVTFYGHYDVQPAAEPDWATNPFELNSVNEYLYGRGVSDNKGPILAFIFAVRELMNSCGEGGAGGCGGGRLPVNVAFVFEGEEENGSRGFATAVTQNLRWFEGTQLIIISNTLWVGENVPCLTYGMRGMLSLTVQITGPERDLHSGNDGGVFAEPMVDLLRVMATLVGPGGQVQVPGFYDNVEPGLIELAWTSLESSEEFSLEGYKEALGVPSLTAPPNKHDLLVTRWCRPSLSVVDMRPGSLVGGQQAEPTSTCYRFGPTRFSVIPKAAQGKVSVRFVPHQDADKLVALLRKHVRDSFHALGSSNTIDLHVEARGNWWEARQGSPWLAMAEAAIHKEWGVHPLYVREGGTMPVASYLERILCAPAIMVPMGQSSDNCHLANERIRRTNLFKGRNVIRRLLEEIATMRPQPGAAGDKAGGGLPAYVDEAMLGTSWGAPTACAGMDQ